MIVYSIIIPHKNSVSLLDRLVNTIPNREDIELIIVDNSEIDLDNIRYSGRKNIVVLYSNKSLGAGHARNQGLKRATGKWILFADADDYFIEGSFLTLDKYVDAKFDVVYFGASGRLADSGLFSARGTKYQNLVSNYLVAKTNENELLLRFKHLVPWAKMIKHSMLLDNEILFEEVAASNDIMFALKVGFYAKSIIADNSVIYCVTEGNGSLTQTISKLSNHSRFVEALKYNKFLKEAGYGKFQISVLVYIKRATKFGFHEVIRLFNLAYQYRSNIILLWIKTKLNRRQGRF